MPCPPVPARKLYCRMHLIRGQEIGFNANSVRGPQFADHKKIPQPVRRMVRGQDLDTKRSLSFRYIVTAPPRSNPLAIRVMRYALFRAH